MSMTRNEKRRRRIKLVVDLIVVLLLFWLIGVTTGWALTSVII